MFGKKNELSLFFWGGGVGDGSKMSLITIINRVLSSEATVNI